MSSEQTLAALAAVSAQLSSDGGLLAAALLGEDRVQLGDSDPQLGALAASGPRSSGREQQVAAVVEAVYEGFLLHGGSSRILNVGDADLNILAGDRLYALGLAQLAALGDLDSVGELADVIGICSQARALDDAALAAAAWEHAASAIGWGGYPAGEEAKAAVAADPDAASAALTDAARALRGAAAQTS